MSNELKVTGYAPIFSTAELPCAVERYGRMGSRGHVYPDKAELADAIYAFACFASGETHLSRVSCRVPQFNAATAYLRIEDADELHNAWAEGDLEETLYDPKDLEYRLSEFSCADPDGNMLRLGSPLATQDKAK
ncbi:MAG: hypothetical protein ACJAYU_001313 [Bradymonadia bacterium]|jgi:hypothetical protein